MTRPLRPLPLPIPISALLSPSTSATPSDPVPSPTAAVLGPLPPTSPLHLALHWLALSDLPAYDDATTRGPSETSARAVMITGPKAGFAGAIEEEDEAWLRDHGGDYGVLHRLKRVDVRCVPRVRNASLAEGGEGIALHLSTYYSSSRSSPSTAERSDGTRTA